MEYLKRHYAELLLLLYLLPMLLLRENAYIVIHDNLDSEISWYTVLARSGQIFEAYGQVEQIMNGIPRVCLPPTWHVITLLFLVFKPFTAYLINYLLVHIIAFFGMYLLLSRHFQIPLPLAKAVALCFAMLPFYTIYGLSIAGQPLLAFALLNLSTKPRKFRDYLIIFSFPFYSSLVFVGVFVIFLLSAWLLIDWWRNKKLNTSLFTGLLLLGSLYAFVEFNLLREMLWHPTFVSHRVEWNFYASSIPFYEAIKRAIINFVLGQYHAASLHTLILTVVIPLALIIGLRQKNQAAKILLAITLINLTFSLIYGFQHWTGLIPLKEHLQLAYTFNFGRFHWLHPTLWYIAFAIASVIILQTGRKTDRYIVILFIAFQLSFNLVHNSEWRGLFAPQAPALTYRQFFAEDLFQQIETYIGKPQESYRVVSIGLHPSIAQYNGFYTLDSYQHNYPLSYKHEFRQIIASELEKSPRWKQYFDNWGSRCYVFVSEVNSFTTTKEQAITIQHLALDTEKLYEMGGRYIFSAARIANAEERGMSLLRVFEDDRFPWRIYLYQVNAPAH